MKRITIYFEGEIVFSTNIENYEINVYNNVFELNFKYKNIECTYSIPANKGYRIEADI